MALTAKSDSLLRVEGLSISFFTDRQPLSIIDRLDFDLAEGTNTALVGESGCGKSVLALALFGLLPASAMVRGQAVFENRVNLLGISERERHRLRGDRMVLVPQNPMSHLNPTLRVGYQLRESLKRHRPLSTRELKGIALHFLARVGFESPERIAEMYPHQLSGGMAQRVLLAIGLTGNPTLVLADEPTRGLDAENQYRYLKLIQELYQDCGLLLITHNLELAAGCDRIMVMYGGEIVETGTSREVLSHPRHPYTRGLMKAHPRQGMQPIPGHTFSFSDIPPGCRFHPRCHHIHAGCDSHHPPLKTVNGNSTRCLYA